MGKGLLCALCLVGCAQGSSEEFHGNAAQVQRCLDAISAAPGTDLGSVVEAIQLLPSASAMQAALDQLQPSIFTSLSIAEQNNTLDVSNALFNRLQSAVMGWNFWITPFGALTNDHRRQNGPGFHASTVGVVLGFDGALCPALDLGGGIAYARSDLSWQEHRGKVHFQSLYADLYVKWAPEHAYLQALFLQSFDFYHTTRKIHFGEDPTAIKRQAISHHNGYGSSGHIKGGWVFSHHKAHFSPYLYAAYLFLHEEGFNEHGADSLDLNVQSKNSSLLFGELGLHTFYAISTRNVAITPFFDLGVEREQRLQGKRERAIFDQSCPLHVVGNAPSQTLFDTALGISFAKAGEEPLFTFAYKGRFARRFSDQSLYAQFIYDF